MIPSDFGIDKISSHTTSKNSFLVEVDYNNDISDSLRKEINKRFKSSKMNQNYKFPRVSKNTAIKISKNIFKSPLFKNSTTELAESKKNRSLSPYETSISKIHKGKYIKKTEFLNSSHTPIPMSATSKLKILNPLPKLNKSSLEVKQVSRSYEITRKRYLK